MGLLVLIYGSLVTKMNRSSSPRMFSKCWYVVMPGKKRIVGVENVVEEEEYNQFDEIPSFDSSYMPRLLANDKTPYL